MGNNLLMCLDTYSIHISIEVNFEVIDIAGSRGAKIKFNLHYQKKSNMCAKIFTNYFENRSLGRGSWECFGLFRLCSFEFGISLENLNGLDTIIKLKNFQ